MFTFPPHLGKNLEIIVLFQNKIKHLLLPSQYQAKLHLNILKQLQNYEYMVTDYHSYLILQTMKSIYSARNVRNLRIQTGNIVG